jgi:hypothetical protein
LRTSFQTPEADEEAQFTIQKRRRAPKVRMAAVAVEDRSELGIPVEEGENGQKGGQPEHGEEHDERGEILAQDDLRHRDGRRVEELLGADLLLLGEEPHRQERDHEEQDDADVVEEGLVDHLVDVDLAGVILVLRHLEGLRVEPPEEAVEEEADEDEEDGDDDVSDRRREVSPELFLGDRPDVCHCTPPPETILR